MPSLVALPSFPDAGRLRRAVSGERERERERPYESAINSSTERPHLEPFAQNVWKYPSKYCAVRADNRGRLVDDAQRRARETMEKRLILLRRRVGDEKSSRCLEIGLAIPRDVDCCQVSFPSGIDLSARVIRTRIV